MKVLSCIAQDGTYDQLRPLRSEHTVLVTILSPQLIGFPSFSVFYQACLETMWRYGGGSA